MGLLGAGSALATTVSKEGFTSTATATITPTRLPADDTAPVTLNFSVKSTRTTPGTPRNLRLMTVKVRTDRQITVDAEGLATCDPAKLGEADLSEARKLCRKALIGSGSGRSVIQYPEQGTFVERYSVLIFNTLVGQKPQLLFFIVYHGGIEEVGTPAILGDAREFAFGMSGAEYDITTLNTLQFKLGASWTYKGKHHSYLNATCATGSIKNRITLAMSNGVKTETTPQRCSGNGRALDRLPRARKLETETSG